jgi:enoyl-CoA hydratase
MSDPRIRLAFNGAIATITLDRADKLNALDASMIAALQQAALDIETRAEIRCAIIRGEGKAFCAGGDIAAWGDLAPIEMWRSWTRAGHRAFDALARLRTPFVAVLTGHAFGGGLELAATADFIVAERHVRLGLPETGLGMVPGWSGSQRLVRRFGSRLVKRLALTGDLLAAEEAHALGLVSEVADTGAGGAAALALANKICARGPIAAQVAKQLINAAEGEEQSFAFEALAGSLTAYTNDLAEGVAAFKAKRQPDFSNS